jgi:hypothetical protein
MTLPLAAGLQPQACSRFVLESQGSEMPAEREKESGGGLLQPSPGLAQKSILRRKTPPHDII